MSIKILNKNLSTLKTEGVALTALQQSVNNYLLNYNNSVHDTMNEENEWNDEH